METKTNDKTMEEKEVKKINLKKHFYLTIYNNVKSYSRLPHYRDLNLKSIQSLLYYAKELERRNIIKKVGYGTWDIIKEYEEELKEVKKINLKSTHVGFDNKTNLYKAAGITIEKLHLYEFKATGITIKKLKRILIHNNIDKCLFCNTSKLYEIHHVIPVSEGGTDSIYNLIPCCPNHHALAHKVGYTKSMKDKLMKYREFIDNNLTQTEEIRGHAFMFHLKIPYIKNWLKRSDYLDKKNIKYNLLKHGQKIIINNKKVHLFNKSIIIYDKKSYISDTSKNSKCNAIESLVKDIEAIEVLFDIPFKIAGKYEFKVCRQHYAKLNDTLAKYYNDKDKKLKVYNSTGLWFVIDKSFNIDEAETLHYKTSDKDMDNAIVPFFNSIKDKKNFTADFILEALGKQIILTKEQENHITALIEDRRYWAKHQKAHVASIQQLGTSVDLQAEGIKKFLILIEDLIKKINKN